MPGYIQIEGDPTKWYFDQSVDVGQVGSQVLSVQVTAPLQGTLLVSPRAASVAVFEHPTVDGGTPLPHTLGAIYLPTAAGPSEGSLGYELPFSVNLPDLASQVTTIMREGQSKTVTLGGAAPAGTLVLNGATLSFVVLCSNTLKVEGAVPHG